MANWFNDLLGMWMPDTIGKLDPRPESQPPRMIPGGPNAPELCMIPHKQPVAVADMARDEHDRRQREVRVVQIKADGLNAVAPPGMMVSGREGSPLDCALHARPGLDRLQNKFGEPMVFMGEYVAHAGFNATLSEHKRGQGEGAFWLNDAVPFDAWASGRPYDVPIESRLARLRDTFMAAETGLFVGLLDHWHLDWGQTHQKAREVWAAGYEGLVSKEAGSGYIRDRSHAWLKIKQRFFAPCALIDMAYKGDKLAAIVLRGPETTGSKPITLRGGWSAADQRAMEIGMGEGASGRVIKISFELTVGTPRTIRDARYEGIAA